MNSQLYSSFFLIVYSDSITNSVGNNYTTGRVFIKFEFVIFAFASALNGNSVGTSFGSSYFEIYFTGSGSSSLIFVNGSAVFVNGDDNFLRLICCRL